MRVIGIDPGLRNMGWGIIDVSGSKLSHVANGICRSDGGADLAARLLDLHDQLTAVFSEYAPDAAAVEQTFVNKDAVATLKLGQAGGLRFWFLLRQGCLSGNIFRTQLRKRLLALGTRIRNKSTIWCDCNCPV